MTTEYDRTQMSQLDAIPVRDAVELPGGITIDAASRDPKGAAIAGVIPAGTPLGKVAGSGKYKPVRRTTVDVDEAIGQTVISVAETTMFKVGDTVQILQDDGTWHNGGAITAIADGDTITITNALVDEASVGAYVEVTESNGASGDSDKTECVLLPRAVDLNDPNMTPVDKAAAAIIEGVVVEQHVNFSAAGPDARLKGDLPGLTFVDRLAVDPTS